MKDETCELAQTSTERGQEFFLDLVLAAVPDVEVLEKTLSLNGKAAVTTFLKWACRQGLLPTLFRGLNMSSADTVCFDYRLRIGIADLVIFHVDGTCTVIELKDGLQGFRSVIAGLGEAGLNACQMDPAKALKGVRRALAWTAVAEPPEGINAAIEQLTREAGAIPLFLPGLKGLVRETFRTCMVSTMDMVRQFLDERKVV